MPAVMEGRETAACAVPRGRDEISGSQGGVAAGQMLLTSSLTLLGSFGFPEMLINY